MKKSILMFLGSIFIAILIFGAFAPSLFQADPSVVEVRQPIGQSWWIPPLSYIMVIAAIWYAGSKWLERNRERKSLDHHIQRPQTWNRDFRR